MHIDWRFRQNGFEKLVTTITNQNVVHLDVDAVLLFPSERPLLSSLVLLFSALYFADH